MYVRFFAEVAARDVYMSLLCVDHNYGIAIRLTRVCS